MCYVRLIRSLANDMKFIWKLGWTALYLNKYEPFINEVSIIYVFRCT